MYTLTLQASTDRHWSDAMTLVFDEPDKGLAGQADEIPQLIADYLRRDLINKILGNSDTTGATS